MSDGLLARMVQALGAEPFALIGGHALLAWARAILTRAVGRATVQGVAIPLVDLADLVLLELHAGGLVDRADVASIAGRADWPAIRAQLEERLPSGPRAARQNWSRWKALLEP